MKKIISQFKSEFLKKANYIAKIILVSLFCFSAIMIVVAIFYPKVILGVAEISKVCHIGKKKYKIVMKNNGYYECNNCSKEMKKEIVFMTNWQQLLQSKRDISQYFERKNGYCEE